LRVVGSGALSQGLHAKQPLGAHGEIRTAAPRPWYVLGARESQNGQYVKRLSRRPTCRYQDVEFNSKIGFKFLFENRDNRIDWKVGNTQVFQVLEFKIVAPLIFREL